MTRIDEGAADADGGDHHGDAPAALHRAARRLLEKGEEVSLRELARRVGVSPTAVYRHFASKDDLLASVAASGFRQLAEEIAAAAARSAPDEARTAAGLAYVEFAMRNPGLFALMFGRRLARRNEFPALRLAGTGMFAALARYGLADPASGRQRSDGRLGPWCYLHGLAQLSTARLASKEAVRRLARAFLTARETAVAA